MTTPLARSFPLGVLFALLVVTPGLAVAGSDTFEPRVIVKEIIVAAPVETVWHAWTTEEGLRFISEKSRVELRSGGPYEWFLDLEPDENGRRGGEGSQVLAVVPNERLEFTWTFPPSVPSLRAAGATTRVVLTLEDLGDGRTKVHFEQSGWKDGVDWDTGYAYFDRAWGYVLQQLQTSFEPPATKALEEEPSQNK